MTNLANIKAISFDVDGTLSDFEKVMRSSLRKTVQELAKSHPEQAAKLRIEDMIAIREATYEDMKQQTIDLGLIRLEAFRRTILSVGIDDDALASQLHQVYMTHRFNDLELYDDTMPTIEALKDSHTLGLLSNGNSRPEVLGLGDVFQFSIFAVDHGAEKPDPKIFQVMMEQVECSPHEVMHVGDSLETDVAGAASVGITSVWLNRDGMSKHSGIVPDYEITTLTELTKFF